MKEAQIWILWALLAITPSIALGVLAYNVKKTVDHDVNPRLKETELWITDRILDRWSGTDHLRFAEELKRLNPELNVPEIHHIEE